MATPSASPKTQRQPQPLRRFWQTVVLTGLVVTGMVTVLRLLGTLETLEIAAYDSFIRNRKADPLDDRLLVVGIDENDIQGRQEYPITEATTVNLIEALERFNPRAIALDFALDFPRGTPAERAALTERLANSENIVSGCLMSLEGSPGVPPAPGIDESLVGFADFPVDKDGVVRRSLLVSLPTALAEAEIIRPHLCNQPDPDFPLFSLSLILADLYLAEEEIFAEQDDNFNIIWDTTVVRGLSERFGGYTRIGAVDYQVMLNYRAPRDAVRQVSLTDILQNRVDPDWIRDRLILIGYTTPAVKDFLQTPYIETELGSREMWGVVAHAQATSQLISAVLDGRPLIGSWPEWGEILLMVGASWIGGLVAYFSRRSLLRVMGLGVAVAVLWGLAYVIFLQGLWLPVVPMTLTGVLAAVGASAVKEARQSVYAQAILEQLQAQMRGQENPSESSSRDRLDDLVRRARAIRERQAIGGVLARGEVDKPQTDPLHMEFDSPEAQTFYERIKAQLQERFDAEKATLQQRSQSPTQPSVKLQSLLEKSQTVRGRTPSSSSHEVPPHG